jgi:membrane-bound ClpP family serine protease
MTRWPPILWLCISVGSLLLLVGWNGADLNPVALALGIVLIVAGAFGSLWLAFGRWGDRPQVGGLAWLLPATVAFYVLCAIAASIAGSQYGIVAIVAGLIPFTAVTLLTATARAKTVGQDDGQRDVAPAAADDPLPGIGGDDGTPVGDTSEHSNAERVARPDDRFERPGRTRAR